MQELLCEERGGEEEELSATPGEQRGSDDLAYEEGVVIVDVPAHTARHMGRGARPVGELLFHFALFIFTPYPTPRTVLLFGKPISVRTRFPVARGTAGPSDHSTR